MLIFFSRSLLLTYGSDLLSLANLSPLSFVRYLPFGFPFYFRVAQSSSFLFSFLRGVSVVFAGGGEVVFLPFIVRCSEKKGGTKRRPLRN